MEVFYFIMFTTIISDCKAENEAGRQISRFNSLGLGPCNLIGISSSLSETATIEGGANLLDVLDATEGRDGVIILNTAPRGDKNDGENGTSFAFFHHKKTLVISTIKGHCLSFVRKTLITTSVHLLDPSAVLLFARTQKLIDKELAERIINSQFRSFEFLPRLARWIKDGIQIPANLQKIDDKPLPNCIWCIDAFGNAKTTIFSNDKALKENHLYSTNLGKFKFFSHLKDIPTGETAIYVGSSGIKNWRFLEIATQGVYGSASKSMGLKIGDTIEFIDER